MNQTTLERAKNLLLNKNYAIADIAEELEFISEHEFVEAFERDVGESPQTYRDKIPQQQHRD